MEDITTFSEVATSFTDINPVQTEIPREDPRTFLEKHGEKDNKKDMVTTIKKSNGFKNMVNALVVAGKLSRAFLSPDMADDYAELAKMGKSIMSSSSGYTQEVAVRTHEDASSIERLMPGSQPNELVTTTQAGISGKPPENYQQMMTVNGQPIGKLV